MYQFIATLHTLGARLRERAAPGSLERRDRGATVVEWVMIIGSAVAMATLAYVAINSFLQGKIALIR